MEGGEIRGWPAMVWGSGRHLHGDATGLLPSDADVEEHCGGGNGSHGDEAPSGGPWGLVATTG